MMALRHVVCFTLLSAGLAAQGYRVEAECIYAIANPASKFRSVVSITQDDGSDSVELDVPEGFPSVVLPAPDGRETYVGVTSVAADCPASSSVLAFSTAGEQRSLLLSTPGSLGALAIHPDGTELYAVDNLVGKLFVIATSTLRVSKVIPMPNAIGFCPEGVDLGGPGFVGMAVSPDGQRLLVTTGWCGHACFESLSVIDTGTDSVVDEIDASFTRVAFGPDSKRAYLQKGGAIAVSLFDVESAMPVDEFPVEVNGLATAPDGVFALTNSNILVLDPQTNTVTREINLHGHLIAADPGADRAYVTTADRTEVVVLKASTGKTIDRLSLENPSWIAAGPCPQSTSSGGSGDAGCSIKRTRPTWLVLSLLGLGFGLFRSRRRHGRVAR